jgi:hypothetical protein
MPPLRLRQVREAAMTSTEPTAKNAGRTHGYPAGWSAGHQRGLTDGAAETNGTYQRDADHRGTTPEGADGGWTDGFLDGYASGRVEAMRGAVA